jgi:hypothetical protein
MTTTLEKASKSIPVTQLPMLGAAMPIKHIGERCNWLLEHDGRSRFLPQ